MMDRAKRLFVAELAAGLILVLGAGALAGAQTNAPAPAPDASSAPAKTIRVQVLGAVLNPGSITLSEGDRLLLALARAGGPVSMRADLSRVILVRANPETGKPAPGYVIDVFQALRRGDQRFDPILRADDKIFVPELRATMRPPAEVAATRRVDLQS